MELTASERPPQRGKPYSDGDLRLVLNAAPTVRNAVALSVMLGRSPDAIELIWKWASTPDKEVRRKRPHNRFVAQVKRVAKEVGWVI